MKILSIIENSNKLLLGILIGIITGSIGISVAYQINASQISYRDTDVTNAIIDLYDMASTHCPDGKTCLEENNFSSSNSKIVKTTYKAIVYLDPTNKNRECTRKQYEIDLLAYNSNNNSTGMKSGCMRWYAYKDNGDSYNLILDHNTTSAIIDCGNDNSCFDRAQEIVNSDTLDWTSVRYEDTTKNPRNISAFELWEITKDNNGKTSWPTNTSLTDSFYLNINSSNALGYDWLINYMDSSINYGGTINDTSNIGYWTNSIVTNTPSNAYMIHMGGLVNLSVGSQGFGVRPVITINKN